MPYIVFGMQDNVLPSYFAVVILIIVLWIVIQKVLNIVGFWQPQVNEAVDVPVCNQRSTPKQCHLNQCTIPELLPNPFRYELGKFSQNGINRESLPSPYDCYKSRVDIKMTADTEVNMSEDNATTNIGSNISGGGEDASSPSSESTKSGLSRRQRKNCRKREKGDSENKQLLVVGSSKSGDVTGTVGSILSSGSSSSLNSQKDASIGTGKKRSSVPLKEREGYGRYATLETYEHLKGMTDQQIYYWIYSYCLDLTRLRHLGFPLDSELQPGKAVIYVDPDVGMRSCTKGGGDLNSSEFCRDDFPPSGAEAKQQIADNSSQTPIKPSQTILPMQIEPDSVPTYDQLLNPKDNTSITSVHENTQIRNLVDDKLDPLTHGGEHSIVFAPTKEDDHSSGSCDSVLPSYSSCNLDANAQEFIPGNVVSTEANILPNPDSTSTAFGLSASAKEFFPSSSSNITLNECEARNCARCNKVFEVSKDGVPISKEKCLYHWGKIWHYGKERSDDAFNSKKHAGRSQQSSLSQSHSGKKSQFTCCNARALAQGCCTAKSHVWRGKLFSSPGMHGPFSSYVRTKKRKHAPASGYHGVYAIDCEMCYTTSGMEVARLSVVGIDGRPVYDSLVQPENPIIDYNTRFSGLTERDFRRGEKEKVASISSCITAIGPPVKSLRDVQNDLMGFISASTIIVGHGLENDFRALRLVHTLVVDTSTLYPHFFGLPYRRSLKSLARSYLKRDIQTGTHDSLEDGRASLELVLCQVKAESEGMSNTIKANSDVKSSGLCHRTVSVPLTHQGNNTALLNASLGGMNSSGILFNNSAMNSGVLPHASVGPSISPVSVFLPHRPGIK